MPSSEPTVMVGSKPPQISDPLQPAHTRKAWITFSVSPLLPQGRKWVTKGAPLSLTLPTNSRHLGWWDLVMNLWRARLFRLIRMWTEGEMKVRWAGLLQPDHYRVLYLGFSNCSSTFSSLVRLWHYGLGGGTVTGRLLSLGSYLATLWEEIHLQHTKSWEKWQQKSV